MASNIKSRGGHRAMATKLINEIKDLLQDTALDYEEIKLNLMRLKDHQTKIQAYDVTIQNEIEESSDLITEMEEADKIWKTIQRSVNACENALKVSTGELRSNSVGQNNIPNKNVQLPNLLLPTFNGNVTEWPQFWDSFNSAVHSRQDLSPIVKFNYFISQLRGEAKQLLEGFPLSNEAYSEAIALATETFGKPKKIIRAHLHGLFDIPSPSCNVADLRKFRASYESHLRALKTLNTKINDAGFVVAALLLRKLPNKIRDNINRSAKNDTWELEEFRQAINLEIELLQSVSNDDDNASKKYNNNNTAAVRPNYGIGNQNKTNKSVPVSTLAITGNDVTKSTKMTESKNNNHSYSERTKKCKLCFDTHFSTDCVKYKYAVDRLERVQNLKLCKRCLNDIHPFKPCKFSRACFYCRKSHHSALCLNHFSKPQEGKSDVVQSVATSALVSSAHSQLSSATLPIATVPIVTDTATWKVRALFDQCSQRTFITENFVKQISLPKSYSLNLAIDGFSSEGKPQNYDVVQFKVLTNSGFVNAEAIVVEKLPGRISTPGLKNVANQLKNVGFNLSDSNLTDYIDDVKLLVGSDQYYNYIHGQMTFENINLLQSNLGHIITGKIPNTSPITDSNLASADVVTVLKIGVDKSGDDSLLDDEMKRLWSLDTIGIEETLMSQEESDTLERFEKNISYVDGKYVTKLPWRSNANKLPSNYNLARVRLKSLQNKLKKEPKMLDHYDTILKDQLSRGFIERVDSREVTGDKLHYLAHHAVKKDSPTTPIRVVMDASAKASSGSLSLNNCLYTGPSLMHELTEILLRFRLCSYACISDITKAFLMVGLHVNDRDATRFLWFENPHDSNSKLIIYRFKVVLFGATCSQFLLNATIRFHLARNPCNTSTNISRNIYVDNLMGTFENEQTIVDFYHESKNLLNNAGFNLHEWESNSTELKTIISNNGDGTKTSQTSKANILGLRWETENDSLNFPSQNIDLNNKFTKRSVLRAVAKVFDPLGLLTPITIRSKIFMQKLWKMKFSWDEIFDENLQTEWLAILGDVQRSLECSFPRRALPSVMTNVDIHAFCDASLLAYGTVIYLVHQNNATLLISKARVTPLKNKTIPRLELIAILLAARLIKYVCNAYQGEFKPRSTHIWSDSQCALSWVASSKPLEVFVKNRVDQIRELTMDTELHYLSTKDNPGDVITRGFTFEKFNNSTIWNQGPCWLTKPNEWPVWSKNESKLPETTCVTTDIQPVKVSTGVFKINRYSSLKKLLNVVLNVMTFLGRLAKTKMQHEKPTLTAAETVIIRQVQEESFSTEMSHLKNKTTNNLIKQLNLFTDENNLLRCKGRFDHANMTYEAKCPILLPSKHHFSELVILDVHATRQHSGTNDVVAHIRQRFWIPNLRQRVKTVLRACVTCKRFQGRHYPCPPEAPLPADRLKDSRPFQATGVDYSGALNVKSDAGIIKVYICLFTCASTRAVHLELVENNTSEAFLRAFRRFVGRRSCPQTMISDNSTTFVASAGHLRQLQDHPEFSEWLLHHRCEWKFIPSRAPWFGGFYERLIGLTKTSLKKILGRNLVSSDELRTILVEVEAKLNDRPLTYCSNNLDDLEVLTPSHLIYGYRLSTFPTPLEDPDSELYLDKPLLNKRQEKCAKILESFWTRWREEYLTALRERQKSQTSEPSELPKVGDVVLIYDESPRLHWRLGRILSTHYGSDNYIRSATVKTSNGIINRAIKHLYPLEISSAVESNENENKVKKVEQSVRPKRAAAEVAKILIKEQS